MAGIHIAVDLLPQHLCLLSTLTENPPEPYTAASFVNIATGDMLSTVDGYGNKGSTNYHVHLKCILTC